MAGLGLSWLAGFACEEETGSWMGGWLHVPGRTVDTDYERASSGLCINAWRSGAWVMALFEESSIAVFIALCALPYSSSHRIHNPSSPHNHPLHPAPPRPSPHLPSTRPTSFPPPTPYQPDTPPPSPTQPSAASPAIASSTP